jgi:hypothetical protein
MTNAARLALRSRAAARRVEDSQTKVEMGCFVSAREMSSCLSDDFQTLSDHSQTVSDDFQEVSVNFKDVAVNFQGAGFNFQGVSVNFQSVAVNLQGMSDGFQTVSGEFQGVSAHFRGVSDGCRDIPDDLPVWQTISWVFQTNPPGRAEKIAVCECDFPVDRREFRDQLINSCGAYE